MPFLPDDANAPAPVQETPPSMGGRFIPDDAGMPSQRTQKDPYAIGSSALGGAVAGFATPEITMGLGKALSAVPYPPAKAAGYALQAGAPFMKTVTGRVLPSIFGGLGGAAGETTKQELEIAGVRPSVAKAAGMGVEFATQPLGD